MATEQHKDCPQFLMPATHGTTPSMRATSLPSPPADRSLAQSGRRSVPSVEKSENGAEVVQAAGGSRLLSVDTLALDRDLWAASQTITASRQERIAIYRALEDANAARSSLEHKYEQAKSAYNQLLEYYEKLYEDNRSLQDRYNVVTTTLEDERALKEALDLELQQAKNELASLEDWEFRELQARDATIERLRGDIKGRDVRLAQLAEKLDALEQHNDQAIAESTEGYEKHEISRLKAESTAREQALDKYRNQTAALSSELESAKLLIQGLQKVQGKTDDNLGQNRQQLQHENKPLREALESIQSSGDETKNEATEAEIEVLRHENLSLAQQLGMVKKALAARFPGLHDNLDNLSSLLVENGEERKRKKRKGTK
ncbi:hypothetical protein MFIFM68171_09717 [Madurella fahalii]|uniref:Uncharacterized protein n=1 Tax=Madurella fahalii TaxID=1157608 RepID=A0ABQ0GP54_9PEZI